MHHIGHFCMNHNWLYAETLFEQLSLWWLKFTDEIVDGHAMVLFELYDRIP